MHRFVSLTDQSTASSKFPGEPPPASSDIRTGKSATAASILAAVDRAIWAIRATVLALLLGVSLSAAAQDTKAPSAPTGLKGTAMSATSINLTWNASTDNVGVRGYYVYLNNVPLGTTTKRSFLHKGLTASTAYNYRVSAFDAVPNHSAWTDSIAVRTLKVSPDTQPPTVPTGLQGTAVSSTQINLSWSASTDNFGVKGYYVYLDDVPLAITSTTSYQHVGRLPGSTHNYRVSAFDAVPNHSAWTSTPVSVTTTGTPAPDTTPPSVPDGLAGIAASATQISLTWSASTDNTAVKGYYVYLNDAPLGTTTTTSFQHTGLTGGTTYNYRVSAFDAVPNHSAWTVTPVSVTTPSSALAPISGAAQFVATFPTTGLFRTGTGDGVSDDGIWWVEQKAGTTRTSVLGIGRDGGTALRLHTEPGDNNVSGSGAHERNDMALPQATTDGYQGREQWWAHSVLFPADYVTPPSGSWGTVFDFHDTRNAGGQANFHIFIEAGGVITLRGHGGPTVVTDSAGNEFSYGAQIGTVVKDTWYDFVYHVKWSSGSDGIFQAWVNGVLKLDHRGPTLYEGYGVYLKLANYHSAFGQSSSVIHDRVIRGPTAQSVAPGPLEGVLTWSNGVLTALQP